jgi:hypothetical protein
MKTDDGCDDKLKLEFFFYFLLFKTHRRKCHESMGWHDAMHLSEMGNGKDCFIFLIHFSNGKRKGLLYFPHSLHYRIEMEINRSECEGYCDWLDTGMEITAGEGLNINMLELIRHHLLEVEDEMDIIDVHHAGGNEPSSSSSSLSFSPTVTWDYIHATATDRHRHRQWLMPK